MDQRIVAFLEKQTCATISCINEEQESHSFTCFIYFDKENECLYFKSSSHSTTHGKILELNNKVSGTVLQDQLEVNAIKGIQFYGEVKKNTIFDIQQAMKYHTKYPMAMAVPGDMWTVQLNYIKFTDNTLGFGTKIEWERE